MKLRYSLLGGLLAVLLAIAPPAVAQAYVAGLSGANEVPPVATAATGTAVATVGEDGTTVTVTGAFSGLESDYNTDIGAHIHMGAAGTNGGVIFPLTPTLDADNRGGTFEAANNMFSFSAAQLDELANDGLYVNIHSVDNPGGEIRGQLSSSERALVITGVVDGPLSGGVPKAIEFYALEDIPDLSVYGFGSANNGGGTDGIEFQLSGSASAGDFLYAASEVPGFTDFFGFAPTFDAGGAAGINGDDAIELFYAPGGAAGVVIDVFGDIDVDGSGQPWEYADGWAYRTDATGPDGSTFEIGHWTFSGIDALDGATTNAGATTPFPIGTYSAGTTGGMTARLQVIHNSPDPAAAVVDVYVNDALYLDDVPFRGASPFQDVPAGVDLKVDIVDGGAADNSSPVFTQTYNLPENTTAQLIATGVVGPGFEANPDGVSTAFTLLASTDAQETAMDPAKVGVRVVHGAPDAPTVDVRTGGTVLVDDAMYTDITGYLPVDPASYALDVTTADGATTVGSFTADLTGAAGGTVTVLASGFLTPENDNDGPAFGLLAVFPNGTAALLPAVTETFAGYLLGDNEVPPVMTDAAGFVTVTLTGNEVTIDGRFAGLSSDYLFSHLHRAPAGGNGPVFATLNPTLGDDDRSGVFDETVTLSDTDVNALRAGEVYVNVHSQTNQGGELRAQLVMNPDTAEVTIAQARNIGPDYAVTVTGVVTRTAGAFAYVQAGDAALAIRQPAGDFFDDVADGTIASGTELRLTGTLSEFAGLLQLNEEELARYEVLGTADVPAAQEVTLAELEANGEAYEAELVRVGGVQFSSTGTFAARTTYPVSDASSSTGAVSARVPNAADTSVDGTAIPAQANVTAIVGQFSFDDPTAGYQLLLIEADDIQNSVASEIDPNGAVVSLTVANPIRGTATVRFSPGTSTTASVALYDMLGRRVATLADGPVSGAQTVSLDAGSLSAGVYVLRLQTEGVALTETVTVVR